MSVIPSYDKIGQLHNSPVPPSSNASDHPPVELQLGYSNGSFSSPNVGLIMGAPGAGLRYRIFWVKMVLYYASAAGLGAQISAGSTLLVLTGYGTSPYWDWWYPAPDLSGVAAPTNQSVNYQVVGSGTVAALMLVLYTTEWV